MQKVRFLFLDGLRGIAALAVVLYHFNGALLEVSQNWTSGLFTKFFDYGYLGVDIFFVISGFVIPYSVSRFEPSFQFLGRFVLRRSIRLDPPYWLTIFLELFVLFLTINYFSSYSSISSLPDMAKVLSHFIYAQDMLGYGNIIEVFWTLCFEVQFYLFFVLSLIFVRNLNKIVGATIANVIIFIIGAGIFVYSILLFFTPLESPIAGLFVPRWFQFFLGFLAMRSVRKGSLRVEFIVASSVILAASALNPSGADNGIVAVVTAGLLVIAGVNGKMGTWLSSRPLQFLGRTSYSLYLIHSVVGWRLIKLLGSWVEPDPALYLLIVLFIAGVAISILVAWAMYILVEKPSLAICRSISLDKPVDLQSLKNSAAERLRWRRTRS